MMIMIIDNDDDDDTQLAVIAAVGRRLANEWASSVGRY